MRKLILLFFIGCTTILNAQQDEPMRVTRCEAVDRKSPISNVFVDSNNIKWVVNNEGLLKVYDLNYSEKQSLPAGTNTLYGVPGGNADIRWNPAELNQLLGNTITADNPITAGIYDAEKDEMWLGTAQTGVYVLETEPGLSLKRHLTAKNSKLRSEKVNKIYIDSLNRKWIGTEEGVLKISRGGKEELIERYFDIRSIAVGPSGVWLLTADYFGKLDRKGTWYPVELPQQSFEGRLTDMAFDVTGRLWVASDVITSYNPKTKKVEIYGPAQYYTSEFATAFANDPNGGIWVATADKGLFLIERAATITLSILVEKELGCAPDAKDGILEARAVGGFPPYTYEWSNGGSSARLTNVSAGNYQVTVTGGRGLKQNAKIEIIDPSIKAGLQIEKTPSEKGSSDAVVTVTASGGEGKYTYLWDNGEKNSQATKLTSGKHSVTVTDANGCSTVAELDVPATAAPLAVDIAETKNIKCVGGTDGALNANVSGGTPPFQYEWSNQGSTQLIEGLAQGNYQVTITDAKGMSVNASYALNQPEVIKANALPTSPASTGNADGQAEVSASGGTGSYTYTWDNGEKASKAIQLAPGKHSVTITDANGCEAIASVEITENILPLTVAIEQTQNIKCAGDNSAALQVKYSGGKGPFNISWNNGGTENEIANLPQGDYSVTLTDGTGATSSASIRVEEPGPLTATALATSPASTDNEDGEAEVKASGGTGQYSVKWDNRETTVKAVKLAPGTRSVTITDANNCSVVASVEITENILPLAANIEQVDEIRCANEATASLQASVSGGKGPFQFSWSNNQSTQQIKGLATGSYSLTITDAVGGTTTASFTVNQPKPLVAQALATSPASTDNQDGEAEVTVSGGTGQFSIKWDNEETTVKATGLAPGIHQVTVTDENQCQTVAEVTITENVLPLAANIEILKELSCYGADDASMKVNYSGGKGPFKFAWSNSSTSDQLNNLSANTYTVTITDAVGGTITASVEITNPAQLEAVTQVLQPASTDNEDGQAEVTISGAQGRYAVKWDNGETAVKAIQLAPGVHKVTVTDANQCETEAEVTITENVLPLAADIEILQEVSCFEAEDASLKVNYSGGKGPFTFSWSNSSTSQQLNNISANTYTVTITDALGSSITVSSEIRNPIALEAEIRVLQPASTDNEDGQAEVSVVGSQGSYSVQWDNGETTNTAKQLAPGEHNVTIVDAQNCQTIANVTITENILPLVVDIEQSAEIKCFGESTASLNATYSGGKGPFQFNWSNGSTSQQLENLAAGDYFVTITDALGSEKVTNFIIGQPYQIQIKFSDIQPASTDNQDGQAKVIAAEGTPPFNYQWDTGEQDAIAVKLGPSTHTVTVTDANGCTQTGNLEITENVLPLTVNIELVKAISCFGAADAEVKAVISGGKKPYSYSWSKEGISGEGPSGLTPGSYTVEITDAIGQKATAPITITEPTQLEISAQANAPARDENTNDGKATVSVKGGTQPYKIQWPSGENTERASRLAYGDNVVTVTDNNGCKLTTNVAIDKRKIPGLVLETVEEGQKISIEALQFDADSTNVKEDYFPVLDELYTFLIENQAVAVEIGGHTNNIPPDWYCDDLSTKRARSVAAYLVNKGIADGRVKFRGYGKRFPIATNETVEGRKKNQRIEITILDLGR
ncbi:MAG: OmpA family protein [Bacteroidota bacterium]